jgi:hypothetical protein
MNFEFTPQMNEISGLGGEHERALRLGVTTGAHWWVEHPEAHATVEGDCKSCWGENPDGVSLLRSINDAVFTRDDGTKVPLAHVLTPSMYYAVMHHVMWIGHHGWASYITAMSEPFALYPEQVQ